MKNSILNDWNYEDESKIDQAASPQNSKNNEFAQTQIQSDLNQYQNVLKIKFNSKLEEKVDTQKEQTSNNSQNDNKYIFKQPLLCNQTQSWPQDNLNSSKYAEQQDEISKCNDESFDKELSKKNGSQNIIKQNIIEQVILNSEKSLNMILSDAQKEIENPQALFEIVQQLAKQVREKDQTIRSMKIENSQNIIKSLNQLPFKCDLTESQEISSKLKQLTLKEEEQINQYEQSIQKL